MIPQYDARVWYGSLEWAMKVGSSLAISGDAATAVRMTLGASPLL